MSTLTEAEAYAVVHAAWDTYRRSQEIPWPATGGGEVLKAQSRLWHLAEPYASGREPLDGADLAAIETARADLAGKVLRYCGPEAAAVIGSEDESGVAA